jgi:hypothetical protein
MEDKCCCCGEDVSSLGELERLMHIEKCLDQQLEAKQQEIESVDTQKYVKPHIPEPELDVEYDLSGMPDYDHMNTTELKKHLDDYGMKKTIETKLARVILKETWLYLNKGVFPKFLTKYL